MRAEHLRQWLIAATQENSPDATNWMKVVAIVKAVFQDGTLAEECTWQKVFLILKGKGYFQGIGLVEVLWKEIVSILNCRIIAAIYFHDTLHGFRAGRGTGISDIESNIL